MTDLLSLTSRFSALSSRIRRTNGEIALSTAQLSSGNRIQSAGQDVAGVSVIAQLRSGLAAMRSAANSLGQANSLLQIADGGLAQIGGMIERINQLALRGTNGALSDTDRNYLNTELLQLMSEVDRTAKSTKFDKINVIYAPRGQATNGTSNPDLMFGTQGQDTISGLEGNDTIYALGGDDTIKAGGSVVPGLQGSVYLSPAAVGSLAVANAYMAANPPDATFIANSLNYNNGATVGAFLGADAASLSNPAVAAAAPDRMIYVFEGIINVPATGTYTFNVGSDDGFDLQIDGASLSQFPGIRGFGFTNANIPLTAGPHTFRLTYFENAGGQNLVVNSDMFASNIVDNSATEYTPIQDGDDTVYGGAGNDVVELRGIRSDYEITDMGDGSISVRDFRTFQNDGTDRLYSVERLRFSDGEEMFFNRRDLPSDNEPATTLRFNVTDSSGKTFDYSIVNASTEGLFDNPTAVNVSTVADAQAAITFIRRGIAAFNRNARLCR
ncbi:MAG: hypothetical protein J0M34_04125 [Alphaproteobacteria bacterium]|nr:hypothetical protein [Alphaproteobacteria bacterium]